jgi:alpha-beta hydrolase superfamily lysophospholipase
LLGLGSSSVRPAKGKLGDWGYFVMIRDDVAMVIEKTVQMFPDSKIVLAGHSLGGHLHALFLSYLTKTKGTLFRYIHANGRKANRR